MGLATLGGRPEAACAPSGRRRILHLITLSVVGGSQDNTFCTCELHDRHRYEVHLGCNPTGQWIERAHRSCDVFHPLPSLVTPLKPWSDLKAFFQILSVLRREQFDLVHTHTAKAGFLGRLAAWLCRVPVVVHTYHAFPFHDFQPICIRSLYLALERLVRPMTDFFITLSKNDRQTGERFGILNSTRAQAIYTGIDFSKLDSTTDSAVTRARLNIPAGWHVVMTAGRLEPQKAPHLLVEAFNQVVKLHPNTVLLLAGDGELRPQVEARIRHLGLDQQIRLLGFRDDVPDLLVASDVFVFSSLWEAMGRAMVEAMLLGRAVVVPAIYGIPEIVRHEQTGLLYEVGRVDQLAAGIARLLGNAEERGRLGENARRLTRQLFDVKEMVAQIEHLYNRLLREPKAATAKYPHRQRAGLSHPLPMEAKSTTCSTDATTHDGARQRLGAFCLV